jgi:hypothetical protein
MHVLEVHSSEATTRRQRHAIVETCANCYSKEVRDSRIQPQREGIIQCYSSSSRVWLQDCMTNTGESQMADKEVVSAVPPLSCPRNKAGRALRFLSKRPHSTEDRQVRSTAQETPPDLRSHHTVTNTPAVSTHSPTTFRYTAQHPGLPSFDPSNPSSPTPRLSTPVLSLSAGRSRL